MAVLCSLVAVGDWVFRESSRPAVPGSPAAKGVRRVKPSKVVKPPDAGAKSWEAEGTAWPRAASGTVSLSAAKVNRGNPASGRVRVAGTPVWAQPVAAPGGLYQGPSAVHVTVTDHKTAQAAGVTGVLFSVTPQGAPAGAGSVKVGVDYRSFANAYGGNFGARLHLVQLPACVLTTPQIPACRTQTAVRAAGNSVQAGNVYATLPSGDVSRASYAQRPQTGQAGFTDASFTSAARATTQAIVLAATTTGSDGDGSAAGSAKPTDLKPSGSWTAGGSAGSFTYSYPIQVPPAASSLVPTVGLSYDSGSVDGQTASTQAQSSWVGDGWSTPDSFIEQSFTSCSNQPEGSDAPQKRNDQCYDGQILMMSLNGASTALVWDSSKQVYKPADDNGERVEHITSFDNGSGTYNHDYWQVTDRTGTVYMFGRNKLPGAGASSPVTNSVDSEPVFSAHSGDPCYNSDWSKSVCTMAYRWHLDFVSDLHGNGMAYYYKQETDNYAENVDTSSVTTTPKANATYVRDSYLDHIDYGLSAANAYAGYNGNGYAPDQVKFFTDGRCSAGGTCPTLTKSNASSFPDIPYDQHCDLNADCTVTSPAHYSTVRLTSITSQQYTGSGYTPVDSWTLTQTMPPTGDGTSPTLWLQSILHTGSDTTAGGSAVTLPAVTFTATQKKNRADTTHDGLPPMIRMRIGSITTETGAVITVTYTQANPCTAPVTVSPSANTTSCFPVYWTPDGSTKQILDWFNKWQVATVSTQDPSGGSATEGTSYTYLGGAAWHYDDNELVKAKNRTYGQFRGYGDVQTFTGQGGDAPTKSETTYYRGMSKNNNSTVVNLTDSQGGVHEDVDQLAGSTLESTSYNYSGGPVTGSTINSYWVSAATATRARSGLPDLTANTTGQVETWTRQTDTSTGTPRKTETDTTFDTDTSSATFGLPETVYAHGDLTDTSQQRCTTTTYAKANTTTNLVGLVVEAETDAKPCGGANPGGKSAPASGEVNTLTAPTSLTRPDDVVSDQRTFYDTNASVGSSWPPTTTWPQAAPAKGDITEVQVANGYSGGAFTYQVKSAALYDSYGRATDSYDPLGHNTHLDFAMSANGLTTGVKSTNALGQSATQNLDPLRGVSVSATDTNNVTSAIHYDGLGRITAEWGANRATTAPANELFTYAVSNSAPTVVTSQVMNAAQGYATSTTLYDSLLRVRQTQTPTPQGGRMVTDNFYDSRGWTWKTNNSWWDSATTPNSTLVSVDDAQVPNQTANSFDGAGRSVLAVSYNNRQIKKQVASAYYSDKTITVPLDASGKPLTAATATATLTDALGRTVETDKYTASPTVAITTSSGSTPITSVAISGGTSQATKYLFNTVGQQTDVRDVPTGADWKTGYNLLGQAVSKTDPDAGNSTIAYDAAGNIVQTTDGNGKTISFAYDALNRKTGEFDAAASAQSGTNQLASWAYDDSSVTYSKGHVTTATTYIGGTGGSAYTSKATGFNVFGEQTGTTFTLPAAEGALAGSYNFTSTYGTTTGLPKSTVYPASPATTNSSGTTATAAGAALPAETVTTGYSTALDLPAGLGGLAVYLNNTTYTAWGQIGQAQLGTTAVKTSLTNTYDPYNGALTDSQLTNTGVSSTPIDHTTYSYDAAGNPTSETNTRQGTQSETQCFGYDLLDRLTQAWTATDACATDPSTNSGAKVGDGITGSAYWTSWSFDALGQRTKQVQHGLSGAADTTTTYTYGANGGGATDTQPHVLHSTSTVTGSSAATTSSFTYDADGSTKQRTINGADQTLSWSDTGQLTAVTTASSGTSYIYGADGNLLLQKDPGKTTLYLPNEQLVLNTTSGANTLTGTRYYSLPGGAQVVRTGTGTNYSFQLTDPHGTSSLTIDNAFTKPVWRQMTPYGAPRGTNPASWPDNLGFLGRPQDDTTGLTDIGARWYDPVNGRFESLDPLFETTDSQQQNGYTYAGSNPITGSDPTGLMWDPGQTPTNRSTTPCVEDPVPCHGFWTSKDQKNAESGGTPSQKANLAEAQRQHLLAHIAELQSEIAKLRAAIARGQARAAQASCGPNAPAACAFYQWANGKIGSFMNWLSGKLAPLKPVLDTISDIAFFASLLTGAGEGAAVIGVGADAIDTGIAGDGYLEALTGDLAAAGNGGRGLDASLAAAEEDLSGFESDLCALPNSFTATTPVLMADGTSKAISQVKIGDHIANATPRANPGDRDEQHTVTAIHITTTDRDYTDITVANHGQTGTITGTTHHLYWDATTRAWTPADHLHPGNLLQSSNGQLATITKVHSYTATTTTYNLTIDSIHTFYVEAGNTPVLVHNSGCGGAIIDEGKWDYMFGRVTEGAHNAPRSAQNLAQLNRIGIHDTAEGRQIMSDFLDGQVVSDSNIARTFSNQYGDFQIRDGLLAGPGGFLHVETTWQVTADGYRLTTLIPRGGP